MNMRPARAVGWVLGLVAAASLLRASGSGDLAAPPLTSFDGLTGWVEGRSPAAAAIALVRLVAEVSAWYVLGLSALHAVSHLLGSAEGHRVADALAVPAVRRAVRAGLGLIETSFQQRHCLGRPSGLHVDIAHMRHGIVVE